MLRRRRHRPLRPAQRQAGSAYQLLAGIGAGAEELLDHLVRHPVRARVLLVLARLDRQSPAPLAATLTRGADTGAVRRTALGPLDERECVELVTADLARDEAVRL
ncbi:hypothetical protein [Streptomyces canus]|uniref:hypothetical protein n=1 Tax=Streptomyces canus TaxID=58343 RepID=UPI002E2DB05A|nr:hypothetical protein [Streptomyces canus]